MPGLALAAALLTRSHAQLLFAVAVKGFRAGPTITVRLENPVNFPSSAVGDQNLPEFYVTTVVPNQDNSHWMLHLRQTYRSGIVPLTRVASPQLAAHSGGIDAANSSVRILLPRVSSLRLVFKSPT